MELDYADESWFVDTRRKCSQTFSHPVACLATQAVVRLVFVKPLFQGGTKNEEFQTLFVFWKACGTRDLNCLCDISFNNCFSVPGIVTYFKSREWSSKTVKFKFFGSTFWALLIASKLRGSISTKRAFRSFEHFKQSAYFDVAHICGQFWNAIDLTLLPWISVFQWDIKT